jgi:hypothetical protein
MKTHTASMKEIAADQIISESLFRFIS